MTLFYGCNGELMHSNPITGEIKNTKDMKKMFFDKNAIAELEKVQESLPQDLKMTDREMLIKILSTAKKD